MAVIAIPRRGRSNLTTNLTTKNTKGWIFLEHLIYLITLNVRGIFINCWP